MPIIEVDGVGRVEVGDEFLKMDSAAQNAFVDTITQSAKAGAKSSDHSLSMADYGADVAKSGGVGLVKGAAGLAGMVGDFTGFLSGAADAVAQAPGRAYNYATKGSFDLPESMKRAREAADRKSISPEKILPGGADVVRGIESVTGPLYKPQTTAGKYAQTAAEFVPGSILAPGSMAANALRYGVLPGLASEAAGQATAGTAYEPYARMAAGVGTAAGGAMLSAPAYAERMAGRAVNGVTEQQFGQAQQLMRDAQARGIRLTVDEAIQQITGGASNVGNLRRVVESTTEGGQQFAPAMAQRPAQMQAATEAALDQISPRAAQPSALGPAMQEAGQGALDRVRGNINRMADPYYQGATQRVPQQDYARLAADPSYQRSLAIVRNDPELGATIAHLPDDSVSVINEVVKNLDQGATAARQTALNPNGNNFVSSLRGGARTQADAAARAASPEYAQARDIGRIGREQVLGPLEAGPVGQIAQAGDHVAQGSALMGNRPSPGEVTRATQNLMTENAPATRGLVREHLGRMADKSVAGLDTAGRPDQFGGAKFAREVRGNAQGGANIEAAIRAASGNPTADNVSRLIDVLQATGQRQRAGSMTAFNQEALGDLKKGGVQSIVQALSKPLQTTKDAVSRNRLGTQAERLAEMLLSGPEGVDRLRAIAAQGSGNRNALLRALLASEGASNSGG